MAQSKNSIQSKYARTLKGKYTELRRQAKRKGFKRILSIEQFTVLHQMNCFYCNGRLSEAGYSLDRVDNTKGYMMRNLVSCCWRCNKVKADMLSHADLILVAEVLGWKKA